MKKLFLLSLFVLLSVFSARAYDFKVGGIYYNLISGTDEVAVTYYDYRNNNYNAYSGSVVIPESVTYNGTTYRVTAIGHSAFDNCSGLTSVVIPECVTSIGESAFRYCRLTSVEIPESVTSIGKEAFWGCRGLTSVTIPESVTSIEESTFDNCSGLTSMTIPESVTFIGKFAFGGCSGLTSVTIPESVTFIGDRAFAYSGLTSLEWNAKYCPLDYWVFDDSIDVVFGDNVEHLPRNVCHSASYSTSLVMVIPESVTSVGSSAFYYWPGSSPLYNSKVFVCLPKNYSGEEYAIPSGIQLIVKDAFYCRDLISVTIPESVTSIEYDAFIYCDSLTSVTSLATIPPRIVCLNENKYEIADVDRYSVFRNYEGTLYVPRGYKEAYQSAPEWCKFSKIEELSSSNPSDPSNPSGPGEVPTGPTANEAALAAAPFAYVQGRTVYLSDNLGEVEAFTATGQRVYRGYDRSFTLPQPGVYILRVVADGRRSKVAVR